MHKDIIQDTDSIEVLNNKILKNGPIICKET